MDQESPHEWADALHPLIGRPREDGIVNVAGSPLDLRYRPEPGVDLRIRPAGEDGTAGFEVIIYDSGTERPASYPPEVPYVPGVKVTVMRARDGGAATTTANWWSVPDADAVLAELRAQSTAAGWTERDEPGPGVLPGMRVVQLERGGERRMLQVTDLGTTSMLLLVDGPADRM